MNYYTLYETINLINGKKYISVHKTEDFNDSYLGSGVGLKRAISKYGVDNFKKEVLVYTESKEDIFDIESYVVTDDFIKREDVYNMKVGGFGGWPTDIVPSDELMERTRLRMLGNTYSKGHIKSPETLNKLRKAALGNDYAKGNILSEETRERMSLAKKGVPKSDSFKYICRERMLNHNNPMFSRESVLKREATKKRNRELKKLQALQNGVV